MDDLSSFFRRSPWRGLNAERAEQIERDRLVQQVLDRQRDRQR